MWGRLGGCVHEGGRWARAGHPGLVCCHRARRGCGHEDYIPRGQKTPPCPLSSPLLGRLVPPRPLPPIKQPPRSPSLGCSGTAVTISVHNAPHAFLASPIPPPPLTVLGVQHCRHGLGAQHTMLGRTLNSPEGRRSGGGEGIQL